MKTQYFKTKGGKYLKAEYDYTEYAENPRNEKFQTNLGKMVFKEQKRHTLGDEQFADWKEFLKSELADEEKFKASAKFIVTLPSVDEAKQNPSLSRFIAGNAELGNWFDAPFFEQMMEEMASSVRENEPDVDISVGIPLNEKSGELTDKMEITIDCPESDSEYTVESQFQFVFDAISENLQSMRLDYDYDVNKDSNLERMTEIELFNKWNEGNLVCLPLEVYEHSGITVHAGENGKVLHDDRSYLADGDITSDGMIFVRKDSWEVQNELKGEAQDKDGVVYNKWTPKTIEEAKTWAENVLRNEVKEYANYLEGQVYDLTMSEFNPATLDWDFSEGFNNLIVDDVESFVKDNYRKEELSEIHSRTMEEIKNSITPEFKKASFDNYVSKIKEILPEFDGDIRFASKAATFALKEKTNSELERKALAEYMAEKGCVNAETTFNFLKESVGAGIIKEKELPPLSFDNPNLECFFSKIKNPERSDNGAVNNALLVDYENKRFAFVTGVSYIIDKPSETYLKKVELLSSGKAVEKEVEKLVKSGFRNTKLKSDYVDQYRKNDDWIKNHIMEQGRER